MRARIRALRAHQLPLISTSPETEIGILAEPLMVPRIGHSLRQDRCRGRDAIISERPATRKRTPQMTTQPTRILKILRLPQVIQRVGISRSSIYAAIQSCAFPAPIPLGRRTVGWLAHEIDAFLEAQIAKREGRT